ncbi:MAG: hypothetical protein CNLJKLNK_00677 [Holosporales bacterium]
MIENIYSKINIKNINNIAVYAATFFILFALPFWINHLSYGLLFPFFPLLLIYKNRNIIVLNILMAALFDIICGFIFPIATFAYIITKSIHEFMLPFILNKTIYKNWGLFCLFVGVYFIPYCGGLFVFQESFFVPYLIADYVLLIIVYPIFSYLFQKIRIHK